MSKITQYYVWHGLLWLDPFPDVLPAAVSRAIKKNHKRVWM